MALVFLIAVGLYRVYHLVPLSELKRRARTGSRPGAAIYKTVAQGTLTDVLLWLAGTVSLIALTKLAAGYSWWLLGLVILAAAWLTVFAPKPKDGGWSWRLAGYASPHVGKAVSSLAPVLRPLTVLFPAGRHPHVHTGFYEKEDLLALLNRQNRLVDNRIPEDELKMAAGALTFGDKKVADVMVPRRQVRFIERDEAIGPMLMDELFKTGHSRFPVIRGSVRPSAPEVVGTLYIPDLLKNLEKPGKVRDIMHHDSRFINETHNLHQALDAILKSQHHLLVVVNNFEEMVGVITLEDILEQIIGRPIVDEFDRYEDLRAVAGRQAKAEQAAHHEPTVKSR